MSTNLRTKEQLIARLREIRSDEFPAELMREISKLQSIVYEKVVIMNTIAKSMSHMVSPFCVNHFVGFDYDSLGSGCDFVVRVSCFHTNMKDFFGDFTTTLSRDLIDFEYEYYLYIGKSDTIDLENEERRLDGIIETMKLVKSILIEQVGNTITVTK